jgi:hypothetical protein
MLENRPVFSKYVFQFQGIHLSDLLNVPTLSDVCRTDIMEETVL